ncbi:hypothetical protein Q3W13_04845 [Mucilaginibacter sp. L3T2-6]|nr:hypothetical protein [Mucilaginibacter sp. L3T2-6]
MSGIRLRTLGNTLTPTIMASEMTIHAHRYVHFEDLQLSTRECYLMLSDLIAKISTLGF